MSVFTDFDTAIQGWRDDEALSGRDPEGDRAATRADARFLRETYCDEDPDCTCVFAGDQADASDCDAHNPRPRSNYNHGQMSFWDPPQAIPPTAAAELLESTWDLMLDEGVA